MQHGLVLIGLVLFSLRVQTPSEKVLNPQNHPKIVVVFGLVVGFVWFGCWFWVLIWWVCLFSWFGWWVGLVWVLDGFFGWRVFRSLVGLVWFGCFGGSCFVWFGFWLGFYLIGFLFFAWLFDDSSIADRCIFVWPIVGFNPKVSGFAMILQVI